MADQDIPPAVLTRHPELRQVEEALNAHRAGRAVTARCPDCDAPLVVTEVPATGMLVVSCPDGRELFRARRKAV